MNWNKNVKRKFKWSLVGVLESRLGHLNIHSCFPSPPSQRKSINSSFVVVLVSLYVIGGNIDIWFDIFILFIYVYMGWWITKYLLLWWQDRRPSILNEFWKQSISLAVLSSMTCVLRSASGFSKLYSAWLHFTFSGMSNSVLCYF